MDMNIRAIACGQGYEASDLDHQRYVMEVHRHIETWILETLSTSHPEFSGFSPCPYSKKAWFGSRVEIRWFHAHQDLKPVLLDAIAHWHDGLEMMILATSLEALEPDQTLQTLEKLCETIAPNDFIALLDHPDLVDTATHHAKLCNGKYSLIFLQKLSHLQQASKKLEHVGYYESWTQADMSRTVFRREDLLGLMPSC
jgi:hypothetical protein